jgi:hypothetical protein
MQEIYSGHGVRFRYPHDWDVTELRQEDHITITVSSPGTSFWSVSVFPDGPEPDELVEAALDAFREEYPELDIYTASAKLCNQRAEAKNIEFVCLELLNSAWVRSIQTPQFTVLVLYQGTDAELEQTGAELERITRSLECMAAPADEEFAGGGFTADEFADDEE